MRACIDEYAARIRHYAPFEEIEIDDLPAPKLDLAVKKAVERGARGAHVVALDSTGKEHDSRGFARALSALGARGKGDIAFVLGGKEGLPRPMLEAAADVWSLSKMTFPHRLARLVLAEQVYRAMTILRGEPYGL